MAKGHQVETHNTAHFLHDYASEQADLRRLYEQAKIDQWNAATDIDWSVPLEGDGGLISDDLVDIHGTRFWDAMSEADRVELNRRVTRWRLIAIAPTARISPMARAPAATGVAIASVSSEYTPSAMPSSPSRTEAPVMRR